MRYFVLFFLFSFNFSQAQDKLPSITIDTTTQNLGIAHDITMYPSIEGLKKQAFFLPREAVEAGLKIELYAAKKTEVDNCNKHILVGNFERKTLEGYGYTYFVFNSNGSIISSKMSCTNSQIQLNFVPSSGRGWTDYNSSQPIVAYAPEGIKLFYKIWRAEHKQTEAFLYE